MEEQLRAILVKPGKYPKLIGIDNELEEFQKIVGGNIEVVHYCRMWNDGVAIVCNEEGKLKGLPISRALYNEAGEHLDLIAGDFLIIGENEEKEDFEGLDLEQALAYMCLFSTERVTL